MPPAIEPDEEDYDSAEDSDFATSDAPSTGEDSDDDGGSGKIVKRTRKDADGDLEMGSGDEGIVAQGRKKKKKKGSKKKPKGAKEDVVDGESESGNDDDGEAGIRVRLRSGRGG